MKMRPSKKCQRYLQKYLLREARADIKNYELKIMNYELGACYLPGN